MAKIHDPNSNPRTNSHSWGLLDDPIGLGVIAGFWAAILFALMPGNGKARLGDTEWPWLDQFRLSPNEGWVRYILAALLFCVCYGFTLSLPCWAFYRLVPRSMGRAMTFCLFVGIILGTPLLVHTFYRFPRFPWPDFAA